MTGAHLHDLAEALFRPRAVALVGAGDRPGKNNARTYGYLRKHGYTGAIYPVNPRRAELYGVRCYASVEDLPPGVDHAFIMTPAPAVPDIVAACGRAGIRVATVFSADFAETGPEGRRLQQRLVAAARAGGVRVVGPNSMGVIGIAPPLALTANTIMELPRLERGRLAVISQSGSLIGTFVSRGAARGIGYSKLVSVGNEADLSVGEIGEMLVDDPETDALLLFLETVRHPQLVAAMARRAHAAGKPVVAYKLGRSEAARRFATSHTGAVAGSDAAADAFFRAHGIVRVRHFETLFECPPLLFAAAPARGRRVAVMSTTGGGGAMVADCLGVLGAEAAPLPDDAVARLAAKGIRVANGPVIDVTFAGAKPENIGAVLDELIASAANDAVVAVIGSSAQFNPEVAVRPLVERAGAAKPLCAFLVPQAEESLKALAAAGVAAFRTPESCADGVMAALGRCRPAPLPASSPVSPEVREALAGAAGPVLGEVAAREVFTGLGIPQAPARFVEDAEAAAAAAAELGFPVAVKLVSPDVAHKTEVGGVVLDLATETAVAEAVRRMREQVLAREGGTRIAGFLVQRMVRGRAEVLVGFRRDPAVGPTVALGVGGVLAEVYRDAAVRLAPTSRESAREMIDDVAGLAPLRGYRGLPRGDLDALADVVVAISRLALVEAPAVVEAEINPLVVGGEGDGAVAVDGLIVLAENGTGETGGG